MSTRSHDIAWAAPTPLLATGQGLGRPALLRFETDDFIERLQAVLAEAPSRLAAFRAIPETWREPMALPTAAEGAPAPPLSAAAQKLRRLIAGRQAVPHSTGGSSGPLKLYQPSQMRHYLVAAMLVCRLPGLPDREIDLAAGDRAGFVLRRLLPPEPAPGPREDPPPFNAATWQEYAWVPGPDGPSWQQLADPSEAPAGEERLPAFPMRYAEADGRNRRLLAGSVPTGRREAYIGAPVARADAATGRALTPAPAPKTARLMLLRADVIEPWRRLIDLAEQTKLRFWDGLSNTEEEIRKQAAAAIGQARDQIQTASWYILLDLHDLLKKHLPQVLGAIGGQAVSLSPAEQALFDALRVMIIPPVLSGALATGGYAVSNVATSLANALSRIDAARTGLEAVVAEFARTPHPTRDPQWPGFLFPLADPNPNHLFFTAPSAKSTLGAADGIDPDLALEEPEARQTQQDCLTALEALIIRAMPDAPPAPDPAPTPAARAGQEPRDAWFVMRPVLDRPGCAPFHSSLVGPGTEPFRIAGFFDSDAPARPVRIGLPLDITPAGLRRFDKKAVVTLSDALCGQLHRMRGLGLGDLVLSVLPWPFHKPLNRAGGAPCTSRDASLSLGLVCSLSIPIITLCALILLIIMVTLFDIIFRWIPWFIMCLPVPGLRAKGPK